MKKLSLATLIFLLSSNIFAKDIKDAVGRDVTIKSNKRIVTAPVVLPAMIYAVSNDDKNIVGMHPMSKKAWKNSLLKKMAPGFKDASTSFIKGGFNINVEELIKLDPSVVFQIASQKKAAKQLESLGIPVMLTPGGGRDFYNYFKATLRTLGDLTDNQKRAKFIWNDFDSTLSMIDKQTKSIPMDKKPKGLIFFNVEQLAATGKGSFAQFWLNKTGATNVASSIKTSPRGASVSMEQVMQWNPDVIYISNFCETMPEDLYENKIAGQDWSNIDAVKNKRVYKIPLGQYRWYPPSSDSSLMLKWMAQKNHPELFTYSMKSEIKKHFDFMYKYDVNEKEIDMILNPKSTGTFK
jgi:iron complex transport system substrate-binding protein